MIQIKKEIHKLAASPIAGNIPLKGFQCTKRRVMAITVELIINGFKALERVFFRTALGKLLVRSRTTAVDGQPKFFGETEKVVLTNRVFKSETSEGISNRLGPKFGFSLKPPERSIQAGQDIETRLGDWDNSISSHKNKSIKNN